MWLGYTHTYLIDTRELRQNGLGKLSGQSFHQVLGWTSHHCACQISQGGEIQRVFQPIVRDGRVQVEVHGKVDQEHALDILLAHVRAVLTAARQTPQLQPTVH